MEKSALESCKELAPPAALSVLAPLKGLAQGRVGRVDRVGRVGRVDRVLSSPLTWLLYHLAPPNKGTFLLSRRGTLFIDVSRLDPTSLEEMWRNEALAR